MGSASSLSNVQMALACIRIYQHSQNTLHLGLHIFTLQPFQLKQRIQIIRLGVMLSSCFVMKFTTKTKRIKKKKRTLQFVKRWKFCLWGTLSPLNLIILIYIVYVLLLTSRAVHLYNIQLSVYLEQGQNLFIIRVHYQTCLDTCSSFRSPGSGSQHLHCGLQPSETPVLQDPVPSSGLRGCRHTCGTCTHLQAKHSYKLKKKNTVQRPVDQINDLLLPFVNKWTRKAPVLL